MKFELVTEYDDGSLVPFAIPIDDCTEKKHINKRIDGIEEQIMRAKWRRNPQRSSKLKA